MCRTVGGRDDGGSGWFVPRRIRWSSIHFNGAMKSFSSVVFLNSMVDSQQRCHDPLRFNSSPPFFPFLPVSAPVLLPPHPISRPPLLTLLPYHRTSSPPTQAPLLSYHPTPPLSTSLPYHHTLSLTTSSHPALAPPYSGVSSYTKVSLILLSPKYSQDTWISWTKLGLDFFHLLFCTGQKLSL